MLSVDAQVTRRGPKRSLTGEQIVDTALELLDASEPLSIRAVAARLGVRPNTLYTYFPDRIALERAIIDRLLGLADPDLLTGRRSWRRRVEDYACALRAVLLRRPGAVGLFFTAAMDGHTAALVGERLLENFTAAGLPAADASRASYAVIVLVLGATALAVADRPPGHRGGEADLVAQRHERLAAVDPAAFPLTATTVQVAAAYNTEAQFRWQLRALLDGCERTPY